MHTRAITLTLLISFLWLSPPASGGVLQEQNRREILNKAYSCQIPFMENMGQLNAECVRYYTKTYAGTVFITTDGEIVYSFPKRGEGNCKKGWVIKERFVGASISNVQGMSKALTTVAYVARKDPSKSRRNISTYKLVSLGEVYRGVHVRLKAQGRNLEKLFWVNPGASPACIRIELEGAKAIKVNDAGELEIQTGLGIVRFTRPVAYQEEGDMRQYVEVAYSVKGNEYGFRVGDYDRSRELIIDPLLSSTFLGGTYDDYATCMALDSSGNVYVAGVTDSTDFPVTTGAYDTTYNSSAFVAKFSGNLQDLLSSTFLDAGDMVHAISLDTEGNVYVAGAATEPGSDLRDFREWDLSFFTDTFWYGCRSDAFILKLDGDLQNLLGSVLLQGSGEKEIATSLSIDSNGNVFIAGLTNSADFPVTTGTSYSGSGWDVFVSKLDNNLQNLLASTLIGGNTCSGEPDECYDYALSMSIDNNGNVLVMGSTVSTDFPVTPGPHDGNHNGSLDVFISKFDNNLQNLLASTFLGGSYEDYGMSLSTDSDRNIYVTGVTYSVDFPTTSSAYDRSYNGNGDVFVSKFDENLTTLLASTFIGGNGGGNGSFPDQAYSIAIDNSGIVYVAGCTHSVNGVEYKFPTTPGAYAPEPFDGHTNGFALKMDGNLQNIDVSTFFGGNPGHDYIYCIIPSSTGEVYVVGKTGSSDFPVTAGSYDTTYNDGGDAFVSKLDGNLSGTSVSSGISGTWNYTETDAWNSCDPNWEVEPGTLSITLTGNDVSVLKGGNTFTGTVNGSTYTVSGRYPYEGGTVEETLTFEFSSATSGSGSSTWTWTDGNTSCNGGSDFTLTKQVASSGGGGGGGGG